MTGICSQCGQLQSLHMMTSRRAIHRDRRKGVGRAFLYCTACEAAWMAHEQRKALADEAGPRRGRPWRSDA